MCNRYTSPRFYGPFWHIPKVFILTLSAKKSTPATSNLAQNKINPAQILRSQSYFNFSESKKQPWNITSPHSLPLGLNSDIIHYMISTEQLAETAFQAGNLVHGTGLGFNFSGIIDEGIKTGSGSADISTRYISFALLSAAGLPDRYNQAFHKGPITQEQAFFPRVSILVSRARLQARFPNDLKAIGGLFRGVISYSDKNIMEHLYEYSAKDGSVFQIPIEGPKGILYYPDEVRLNLVSDLNARVEPDLWDGLVVHSEDLDKVLWAVTQAQRIIHLPIFSPEAELLLAST